MVSMGLLMTSKFTSVGKVQNCQYIGSCRDQDGLGSMSLFIVEKALVIGLGVGGHVREVLPTERLHEAHNQLIYRHFQKSTEITNAIFFNGLKVFMQLPWYCQYSSRPLMVFNQYDRSSAWSWAAPAWVLPVYQRSWPALSYPNHQWSPVHPASVHRRCTVQLPLALDFQRTGTVTAGVAGFTCHGVL